jgi:hypothetical protein
MRSSLAALLALSLGCSPTTSPPTYTPADAGSHDAPAAYALDGLGDALTTVTPDVPDAGDGAEGSPCADRTRGNGMVCAGACDFVSCGRCGNVCPKFYSCCQGSPDHCCITP